MKRGGTKNKTLQSHLDLNINKGDKLIKFLRLAILRETTLRLIKGYRNKNLHSRGKDSFRT